MKIQFEAPDLRIENFDDFVREMDKDVMLFQKYGRRAYEQRLRGEHEKWPKNSDKWRFPVTAQEHAELEAQGFGEQFMGLVPYIHDKL